MASTKQDALEIMQGIEAKKLVLTREGGRETERRQEWVEDGGGPLAGEADSDLLRDAKGRCKQQTVLTVSRVVEVSCQKESLVEALDSGCIGISLADRRPEGRSETDFCNYNSRHASLRPEYTYFSTPAKPRLKQPTPEQQRDTSTTGQ